MCSILNAVDKTIIGSIEPLTDWGIVGMPQSVFRAFGSARPNWTLHTWRTRRNSNGRRGENPKEREGCEACVKL